VITLDGFREEFDKILNPIVSGLQAGIVKPVSELLGVTMGGADVWGVQGSTSCDNPRLRG